MTKTLIVALLAAMSFALTSCGVPTPIKDDKTVQQAVVEDLVLQVRLALTALAKRYNPDNSELPWQLKLTEAKIKVSTSFEETDSGNVKLIISGEGSITDKDESYIELTMSAPFPYKNNDMLATEPPDVLSDKRANFLSESVNVILFQRHEIY